MYVITLGHVDSGKSTLCGLLLTAKQEVDTRTVEKNREEAKRNNRESWAHAYVMDIDEQERAKGKTIDVGYAKFSTDKREYVLLDAPGHKGYVPNMIGGTAMADVAILVISARKGEFEAGIGGGQTKEHLLIARALGISRFIVAITKVDLVGPERIEEIKKKVKKLKVPNAKYVSISAVTGEGVKDLFDALDSIDPAVLEGPPRIVSMGGGIGKVISGKSDKMFHEDKEVEVDTSVLPAKLDVKAGTVLTATPSRLYILFEAQVVIVESIRPITVGYQCILHVGTAQVGCEIHKMNGYATRGLVTCQIKTDPVHIDKYDVVPALGRFIMRDGGVTIGYGKVMKISKR